MFSTVAIFLSILITLFWDLAKIITTYSLDKANPILSIIFVIASLITADTLYMVWIGKEVLKTGYTHSVTHTANVLLKYSKNTYSQIHLTLCLILQTSHMIG